MKSQIKEHDYDIKYTPWYKLNVNSVLVNEFWNPFEITS